MPWDGQSHLVPDGWQAAHALATRRRAGAVALWRTVSPDAFDITHWCGTRACALGWLAKRGYDGWLLFEDEPVRHNQPSYRAAARYFGITEQEAMRLFAVGYWVDPHDSSSYTFNTLSLPQIGKTLLAMPVTLNGDLPAAAQAITGAHHAV